MAQNDRKCNEIINGSNMTTNDVMANLNASNMAPNDMNANVTVKEGPLCQFSCNQRTSNEHAQSEC